MAQERILIVDDEEDIRVLLSRILKPHGFQVKTASDPASALETIEDFQPQLLITDINMPGMTGVELARVVRKLSPHTAIIVITAYANTEFTWVQVDSEYYALIATETQAAATDFTATDTIDIIVIQ